MSKRTKMVGFIGFALTVILLLMALSPLDTKHQSYLLLRAEADENASALDLTSEGDFASMPSSAVPLRTKGDGTGHGGNAIEIVFCGGSAAGKTFTYKIYAWRRYNGMARMLATGTGTLGTQAVVLYPDSASTATSKYWADTLTVTYRWLSIVSSSDAVGNNETASLQCDFSGYEWIYVEITNADGSTGDEAGDITAYYAYW